MIDFSPTVQTILTAAGAVVVAVLAVLIFVIPRLGRAMLRADRRSEWGARFVLLGVEAKALGRTPAAKLFPPPIRMALESIPDTDPPPPSGASER